MPQGTLPSQYVDERRSGGLTGLSGLATYWERQHPAGGGWGCGGAVLQAHVLPPRWRRSRESCMLPDRPWERQHPAGRGGWWGWRRRLASQRPAPKSTT